ncbi:glycosyltransferase family 4 protein [Egicoccus sp. AB-alg2]|uniref:glycosyltransferase family 4 protein n=1 Tax=Egicoccus sp. AB-alg2 TaxID=3242693 RepID=UPI00359E4202
MRILQIAPPWFAVPPSGYGGTEQVVSLLTEGLVAAGHQVTLLAAGGSHTRARLWRTFEAPPSTKLGDPVVELAHGLRGHLHRREFDVVHDHTVTGAALAAVGEGPPVVHTLHGAWTDDNATFYAALAGRVALVAISDDQATRRPADVDVAAVVHNAVDVQAHPFVRTKGDHLVFIGRASPDKGPDLAIEVARRLGRRLRMAVKVNEPDEHRYFREVLVPRLASADVELVEIRHPRQKLALLAGAQAVLFPIRWPEPFGLVPLEANACGTPVVAFANGAVPEVVADGRSGFLVAPGDLDGLCVAATQAVELDPVACRQHALDHFDVPDLVAGYLRVYERVVADGRPPGAHAPGREDVHLLPWGSGEATSRGRRPNGDRRAVFR